jgi:hypothetical protein
MCLLKTCAGTCMICTIYRAVPTKNGDKVISTYAHVWAVDQPYYGLSACLSLFVLFLRDTM